MSHAPRRRADPAGAARVACVAAVLAAAIASPARGHEGVCVEIRAARTDMLLARWNAASGEELRLSYVHSVTRTPVEERYRIEGAALRQTEIRFTDHGPGLPTEADAGPDASWSHREGRFVVGLSRKFDTITARVDPDQSPRLAVAGRSVDLAQWGRRSIELAVRPGPCDPGSTGRPAP